MPRCFDTDTTSNRARLISIADLPSPDNRAWPAESC